MPAKTKVEIINETVEHYKTHPRAVTIEGCQYLDLKTGNKCGVGRCQIDPNPEWMGCPSSGITSGTDDNPIDFEASLKPEYRGHSAEFWDEIQHLHDGQWLWYSSELTTGGHRLTDEGVQYRDELLEKYKDR